MPKTRARPPRKQRGESAKITIANQNREIAILTNRCEELVFARDTALSKAHRSEMDVALVRNNLSHEEQFRSADLKRLADARTEITRLKTHIEGYRMALADFMQPERIPRIG